MSDFTSIPVIDLKDIHEPEGVEKVAEQVHKACKEVGFFYIINHGIPEQLQKDMEEKSIEFFKLPVEEKNKIAMEKAGMAWRGYFPVGGEYTMGRIDQKEGIYFGTELDSTHPAVVAKTPMHGLNLFPENPSELGPIVLNYMNSLVNLVHLFIKSIAIGLKLPEDYFQIRFTDDPTILFRIFNYPEHIFKDEDDEWGVREHTDMGFLTILLQDNSGGLQVKNKSGKWIDAPPINNSFVVNIGDMLEIWTHGLYTATLHRVRNLANGPRLSFPFFFDPNWNASLQPIERELISFDEGTNVSNSEKRWDRLDLNSVYGKTYGEFVWAKIAKVFPNLARAERLTKINIEF